eukprot:COSAG01_NODE_71928_length_254_cov_0.993548_1_plen_66_part_10
MFSMSMYLRTKSAGTHTKAGGGGHTHEGRGAGAHTMHDRSADHTHARHPLHLEHHSSGLCLRRTHA